MYFPHHALHGVCVFFGIQLAFTMTSVGLFSVIQFRFKHRTRSFRHILSPNV